MLLRDNLALTALTFGSGTRPTRTLLIGTFIFLAVDVEATGQVFLDSLIPEGDCFDVRWRTVCFIGIEGVLSVVKFIESISSTAFVFHLQHVLH
jgi:hypothetical protein